MRPAFALLVAAIIVVAIVMWRGSRRESTPPGRDAARAAAMAPIQTPGSGTADRATSGARKLSAADRLALRAQIEAALHHRRAEASTAAGAGKPSALPDEDPILRVEQVGKAAQDALRSAIPLLADCYQGSAADRTALAQMVMISDPDLGTVIDTSTITGADGAPLAPALDDCMRRAIESLALPPLGVPGVLPLQYSFRFD